MYLASMLYHSSHLRIWVQMFRSSKNILGSSIQSILNLYCKPLWVKLDMSNIKLCLVVFYHFHQVKHYLCSHPAAMWWVSATGKFSDIYNPRKHQLSSVVRLSRYRALVNDAEKIVSAVFLTDKSYQKEETAIYSILSGYGYGLWSLQPQDFINIPD